jgi:hypothetical protein
LQQSGSDIRALGEYQAFWDEYAGEIPTNHPIKTNAGRSEDDANVDP